MISRTLIGEFKQKLGEDNVFSDRTDRLTYSYDAAVLEPVVPEPVLRPTDILNPGRIFGTGYRENASWPISKS